MQISEKMADFDDVVVKPYRINEMLDQIERAVREGAKIRVPRMVGDSNGEEVNRDGEREVDDGDGGRKDVHSPDALQSEATRRSSVWAEIGK